MAVVRDRLLDMFPVPAIAKMRDHDDKPVSYEHVVFRRRLRLVRGIGRWPPWRRRAAAMVLPLPRVLTDNL